MHAYNTCTEWSKLEYPEKTTNGQPCKQMIYLERGMSETNPKHHVMVTGTLVIVPSTT